MTRKPPGAFGQSLRPAAVRLRPAHARCTRSRFFLCVPRAQEWLRARREARLEPGASRPQARGPDGAPPGFLETKLALLDIEGADAVSELVGSILIRMLPLSRADGPGPQALRFAIDAASGGFRGPAEEIDTLSAFGTALWRVESLLATADTAQLTALADECRRWADEGSARSASQTRGEAGDPASAGVADATAGPVPPRDIERRMELTTSALLLSETLKAAPDRAAGTRADGEAAAAELDGVVGEGVSGRVVGPRRDLDAVLRARLREDRSGDLSARTALTDRMAGWAGLGASGAGGACAAPRLLDPLAVARAAIEAVPIAGPAAGSSSNVDSVARQVRHTAVALAEGSRRDAGAALAARAWPEAAAALAEAERLGRPARDPALVSPLASLRLAATSAYVDDLASSATAPALVDAAGASLAAARRASRAARRAGDPAAEVHALLEGARVAVKRPGAGDVAGVAAARRASAEAAMLAVRVRVAAVGVSTAPAPPEGEADDVDEAVGETFLPLKDEVRGDAAATRARNRALGLAALRCRRLSGAGAELLSAAAWHGAGYAGLAAAHARAAAAAAFEDGDRVSLSIARAQIDAVRAAASVSRAAEGVGDPRDAYDEAEVATDRASAVGDAEGSAAGLCAAAEASLRAGVSSTALPCALAAERAARAAGTGGRIGEAKLRGAQALFGLSGLSRGRSGAARDAAAPDAAFCALSTVAAAAAQAAALEAALRLEAAGKAALAGEARRAWKDATAALAA